MHIRPNAHQTMTKGCQLFLNSKCSIMKGSRLSIIMVTAWGKTWKSKVLPGFYKIECWVLVISVAHQWFSHHCTVEKLEKRTSVHYSGLAYQNLFGDGCDNGHKFTTSYITLNLMHNHPQNVGHGSQPRTGTTWINISFHAGDIRSQ